MPTNWYRNTHSLRDGNIMLYVRADAAKKGIFTMRIKRPDGGGYVTRSTKTPNLAEASRIAEDEFDNMRFRHRNNLPVIPKSFKHLFEEWWTHDGCNLGEQRQKYFKKAYRAYFIPFFGDRNADEINQAEANRYWEWRGSYWTTGPGKKRANKTRSFVEKPSYGTLKQERQAVKQVLRWAFKEKLIEQVPDFDLPSNYTRAERKPNRRPYFTRSDWNILTNKLPAWTERSTDKNHRYARRMMRYYILILANSGLRTDEAEKIKWKDIAYYVRNGEGHVKIMVPEDTKTGSRENVCMPSVIDYLARLKKVSKFTEPEDYVFTTYKGTPFKRKWRSFKRMLTEFELLTDSYGDARTPYCLRHTYITFRILIGGVDWGTLANNAGTSVEMIQDHYNHVTNEMATEELTAFKNNPNALSEG